MKEEQFTNDPEWERIAVQFMRQIENMKKKKPDESKK